MARSHTLFLHRKDVPARGPLQQAVDALKLKTTLDDGYVPFETSGYLPCTLNGEDAGFTIRFGDIPAELPAAVAGALEGRDVAVDIKWSGDVREKLAAFAVSAALAKSFGAVIADGDRLVSGDALHKTAKAELDELD